MAKRVQELKADTVLKNYWNNKEQFADLFNAVLFQGETVIKAEELEDGDTESSFVLEHKRYIEALKSSRDHIKIQKKSSISGVHLVLLALESQEHIHYAMPMRIMGYDYSSYQKQYQELVNRHKRAKDLEGDEYLSGIHKTDQLFPVITIVIYYGEKPWDAATTLHEMLQIPFKMKKYVNNYTMLLVEARESHLKLHNMNNVDLFCLLRILLDTSKSAKEVKAEAIQYVKEHSVDKSVIMAIAGTAKCKIDYHALSEKEEGSMWRVFEETREEGKIEGKAEGKKEGKVELILELLEEVGQVPEKLREQIMEEKEPAVLRKWCRIAAQVMSVEEFQRRCEEIS